MGVAFYSVVHLKFTRLGSRTERKLLVPNSLALLSDVHGDEVGRQNNHADACFELEDYHFGVMNSISLNLPAQACHTQNAHDVISVTFGTVWPLWERTNAWQLIVNENLKRTRISYGEC